MCWLRSATTATDPALTVNNPAAAASIRDVWGRYFIHPASRLRPKVVMEMKRPILGLLAATVALTSCQTAHRAAVSTFRVIDAPHQYIRRALAVDENDNPQTTTTTTTTQTSAAPNNGTYPQPFQQQAAPPPPSQQTYSERRVVTSEQPPPPVRSEVVTTERKSAPPPPTPTPAPRVTSRSTTNTTSPSTTRQSEPKTTSTSTTQTNPTGQTSLPYAKPVPGKPGYVFSPYDKNGGYVDVTGFAPGSKVKDPYSGKVFLVP
jgi:hypothetical protein